MTLFYTGETVNSPTGIRCQVLDPSRLDFSGAVMGRKSAETLVRKAAGGERLETKNSAGVVESVYVAKPGDAIFVNLHNPDDSYVPGNPDGSRWQFDELEAKGYETVGKDAKNNGIRVKNTKAFKILHEAVQTATCLKDVYGPGQHVFLFKGATLKLNDNGMVSGIDKEAFDATWEIVAAAPKPKGKKSTPTP